MSRLASESFPLDDAALWRCRKMCPSMTVGSRKREIGELGGDERRDHVVPRLVRSDFRGLAVERYEVSVHARARGRIVDDTSGAQGPGRRAVQMRGRGSRHRGAERALEGGSVYAFDVLGNETRSVDVRDVRDQYIVSFEVVIERRLEWGYSGEQ